MKQAKSTAYHEAVMLSLMSLYLRVINSLTLQFVWKQGDLNITVTPGMKRFRASFKSTKEAVLAEIARLTAVVLLKHWRISEDAGWANDLEKIRNWEQDT